MLLITMIAAMAPPAASTGKRSRQVRLTARSCAVARRSTRASGPARQLPSFSRSSSNRTDGKIVAQPVENAAAPREPERGRLEQKDAAASSPRLPGNPESGLVAADEERRNGVADDIRLQWRKRLVRSLACVEPHGMGRQGHHDRCRSACWKRELDLARKLDDGLGMVAILEQRVFEGLRD